MNVDNQTILHVKAGHLPPDDLLEMLLGKSPNAFGFTVQSVFEDKPDLAVIREDATNMNLSELKQLFVNAKDDPISVWFGKLAEGYDPEDIQPFLIRDSADNAFITINLEGDILGNTEPATHTEQYNYINGLLIPKVVEWCEDFEGDLDKITKKLRSDTFRKEFMMHVGHRAVLHIIPIEGDPVTLGKNDLGLEDQDWGWCSQKPKGYGEEVPEAVVEEAQPTARRFWGGSKKPATSVPAAGHTQNANGVYEAKDANGKPIHDAGTPEKSETSYPAKGKEAGNKDGAPTIVAKPPAWAKTNDDVKLWYDIVCGRVHDQWKKRLPGVVKDFEAAKIDNLQAFKTYALSKKLESTGETGTSAGKVPAATAAGDKKVISGAMGDKELPIIGPKDLEKVLEYVAKFIDGNSKSIIAPQDMQAIERELPNFAIALGMKPEETLNWTLGALIGIGNTDVRALAMYALMWRAIARPYVQKAGGVVTKTEKLGDNTVKTESVDTTAHVLAKDELKPTKPRFWGGSKAA